MFCDPPKPQTPIIVIPSRAQFIHQRPDALPVLCLQLSIGCVRARFAKHIAILILVDACASAIGFYLLGYAFAWGDHADNEDGSTSQNRFIGSQYFALSRLPHTQYYLWVFQWSVSPPPPGLFYCQLTYLVVSVA